MSNTPPFNSENSGFTLDLPDWAVEELNKLPTHFPTIEERMTTVIEFSRLNFQRKTGGPFAAGVFERDSGRLVTIGVNRVMPFHCSSAHAEVMAISLAQKLLGVYDLGAGDLPAHQLVVNWRPHDVFRRGSLVRCALAGHRGRWAGVGRERGLTRGRSIQNGGLNWINGELAWLRMCCDRKRLRRTRSFRLVGRLFIMRGLGKRGDALLINQLQTKNGKHRFF